MTAQHVVIGLSILLGAGVGYYIGQARAFRYIERTSLPRLDPADLDDIVHEGKK